MGPKEPGHGEILTTIPLADTDQVAAAARAAHHCHQGDIWRRKTSRKERAGLLNAIAQIIRENTQKLAILESLPNGKLLSEALSDDIPTCADIFEYYAGWTDKFYGEVSPVEDGFLNYTNKEPVGVCAYRAMELSALSKLKIAPALAMGNTVVMKPSEYPLATQYLFELIDHKLDLPAGVLNLLICDGPTANHLTVSRDVQKFPAGSTNVGRQIVRNSGIKLKAVTLELGGKSPCIIFDDTLDLDGAIDRAFHIMFFYG